MAADPAMKLDLPPDVERHFADLNGGGWRELPGAGAWTEYEERPIAAAAVGDLLAVRCHFTGTAATGGVVETECATAFGSDGQAEPIGRQPLDGVPAVAVVAEYFRSSNEEDWDAFDALWAEDGELNAVGGPPRYGRPDVVRAYRGFLGLFPTHHDVVHRIIVMGRNASVTGRFYVTNPHGVAIEFGWMDLIELTPDERGIQRLAHWHDRDLARRLMDLTEPPAR
jgi:hypothetical protein